MKKTLLLYFIAVMALAANAPVYAQALPSWVRMGMSEQQIRQNFSGSLILELGEGLNSDLRFLNGNAGNLQYEFWLHYRTGLVGVVLFENFSVSTFNSIISSFRLRHGEPELDGDEYIFYRNLPPDIEEISVSVASGLIEIFYVFWNFP
ncbi:MAG: hypothetical protein FWG66_11275 [Spirochaetes bacterium]|nr:hypothetical protein [Spirochaetota bacterium]